MGDFHQNGSVATLHNLTARPVEDLEKDLLAFSQRRPLGLVIPSLYSELGAPALTTIVDELCEVPYLSEIVIGIEDNGSGISPEIMGSLFEPFRSGRKSGTGLGLLIVRRIVREHGGEIEVESEEERGTRISLFFPRAEKRVRLLEDPQKTVIEV